MCVLQNQWVVFIQSFLSDLKKKDQFRLIIGFVLLFIDLFFKKSVFYNAWLHNHFTQKLFKVLLILSDIVFVFFNYKIFLFA